MVGNSQVMSQSITDRMSHVMQINELMSDSIEISYHFDELSNVIAWNIFNPHISSSTAVHLRISLDSQSLCMSLCIVTLHVTLQSMPREYYATPNGDLVIHLVYSYYHRILMNPQLTRWLRTHQDSTDFTNTPRRDAAARGSQGGPLHFSVISPIPKRSEVALAPSTAWGGRSACLRTPILLTGEGARPVCERPYY